MDDSDQPDPRSDDLRRVIAMTLLRRDQITKEYWEISDWIEEAEANIRNARARMAQLSEAYDQCYSTGDLFGFDLDAESEKRLDADARPHPQIKPSNLLRHEVTEKPKSIRELVLEIGREAGDRPLRAAEIREILITKYGLTDLHSKTVGMTLYRLSKNEGAFTRTGYDWYFVPEAQRGSAKPRVSVTESDPW